MHNEQLNKVFLQGTVGSVRTRAIMDKVVVDFTLATNYLYKDRNGCAVYETTWHHCQKFFDKADGTAFIEKGALLSVAGRLKMERYVSTNGSERYEPCVIAQEVKPADDRAFAFRMVEDAMKMLLQSVITRVEAGWNIPEDEKVSAFIYDDGDFPGDDITAEMEVRSLRVNDGQLEAFLTFKDNDDDFADGFEDDAHSKWTIIDPAMHGLFEQSLLSIADRIVAPEAYKSSGIHR